MAITSPRKRWDSYYLQWQKYTKFIHIPLKLSRSTGHKSSYFVDIDRELFHDEGSQL
jgi:hypothetical protein